MAAPTYVTNSESSDTAVQASHDVTIPAHSSGETLVMYFGCTASSADPMHPVTTPSGWTLIGTDEEGDGSAVRLSVFTKVGTGSTTAVTVSFTSGTGGHCSVVAVYNNMKKDADVSGFSTATAIDRDLDAPAVTTTKADTMVVRAVVADYYGMSGTGYDDNFTTAVGRAQNERTAPGNGMCIAIADNQQASIGTTGIEAFYNGAYDEHYKAFTAAFEAADAPAGDTYVLTA